MTVIENSAADQAASRVKRGPNWMWVAAVAVAFVAIALIITALRPPPDLGFVPDTGGLARKPTPEQAPFLPINHLVATIAQTVIGLVGVVLGVFAYMGALKFVLNRDPFDLDYKPTEDTEFLRVN
jgi:hypothetical protein